MTAMNLEQARFNMVEQQIRPWNVVDQDVLDLLYTVRREEFVPPTWRALAFADIEIPLRDNAEPGESMMAPKIEARILQALAIRKAERVLEVGTGSGHMCALLAAHAQHVHSVEISPELKTFGEANLARAGITNASVELGDASHGCARHAPYDIIVLTGSTPVLPKEFLDQLKTGGRLFAVVGDLPIMEGRLFTRVSDSDYKSIGLFETCLAPLKNAPQPTRFEF